MYTLDARSRQNVLESVKGRPRAAYYRLPRKQFDGSNTSSSQLCRKKLCYNNYVGANFAFSSFQALPYSCNKTATLAESIGRQCDSHMPLRNISACPGIYTYTVYRNTQ